MNGEASTPETLATGQLESTLTLLTELWQAIDAGEPYDGNDDAGEYLSEMPLEIVYAMGRPFTVVLGTGGPHVEITADAYAGKVHDTTLHVYWGGEHVMGGKYVVERTAQHFLEYAWEMGGSC